MIFYVKDINSDFLFFFIRPIKLQLYDAVTDLIHTMLSISMAYNVISCKKIGRHTQKI